MVRRSSRTAAMVVMLTRDGAPEHASWMMLGRSDGPADSGLRMCKPVLREVSTGVR
jgi:hypothetical protein